MFTETERQIFKYHDGSADRWADPMQVWRKLTDAVDEQESTLEDLLNLVRHEAPQVFLPAIAKLAAAVRAAFDLSPLDPATGEGTTEAEVLGILYQFLAFQDESKKKQETSGPTSGPSDTPPA